MSAFNLANLFLWLFKIYFLIIHSLKIQKLICHVSSTRCMSCDLLGLFACCNWLMGCLVFFQNIICFLKENKLFAVLLYRNINCLNRPNLQNRRTLFIFFVLVTVWPPHKKRFSFPRPPLHSHHFQAFSRHMPSSH